MQCMSRHEDFLALKLNLESSQVCLDVGCGVGGPMREIAKISGARVVGLNNNEYQVKRCGYLAKKTGLESVVSAVKVCNSFPPSFICTFFAGFAHYLSSRTCLL
jgi:sterol 24-C-methyltransferase